MIRMSIILVVMMIYRYDVDNGGDTDDLIIDDTRGDSVDVDDDDANDISYDANHWISAS